MRGINTRKNRRQKESAKAKGFQRKFYIIVGAITLLLVVLVYLAYSRY